jgi:hypothetical protein
MSIFATMFRRATPSAAESGPPAAEMRGRAAEIADPGALGWEVVWEALKTEPPADDASTLTQELGLDQERDLNQKFNGASCGIEFGGTRHGRQVVLRLGVVHGFREKPFNEVHVAASVPPFRLVAEDGRLVAEPGAMAEVEEVLAALAPAPATWRDLEVEGGPEEIVARRPVTMRGNDQGYVYDLWLVERLAERLGS